MKITVAQLNKLLATLDDKSKPLAVRQKAARDYNDGVKKLDKLTESARQMFPHSMFNPNPPQYRFFKMVDTGVRERKVYDFVAPFGNGIGKTVSLAVLIATLAWDRPSRFFEKMPLFMDFKSVFPNAKKRVRLGCESKSIREHSGALYQAFLDWWPKDGSWKALKQGYDYPTLFLLPNGWQVNVCTFEQGEKSKESDEICLAVFDEPPPVSDWFAAGPRMRNGGIRIIFATLCLDSEGISTEIMNQPTTEFFYADTRQNSTEYCEDLDGFHLTGKLSPDRVEEMIAKMRPEEREYRVTGKPIHLRGRAFSIDSDIHFVSAKMIPPTGTTCIVVDPHPRKPWFIGVDRRDYYGNVFRVDEWPKPSDFSSTYFHKIEKDMRGIGFFADQIKRLASLWKAEFMVLDFRFANQQVREDEWAVSTVNKLRDKYGLVFEKGSTQVSGEGGAIRELQDALAGDAEHPPRLRIVRENCQNTAYLLENVCWKDDKEKLDPVMDDGARSLMYAVMAPWDTYVPVSIPKHESGRSWEEIDLENRWLEKVEERQRGRQHHQLEELVA